MKMWNLVSMCALGIMVAVIAIRGYYTDVATNRNAEAVKELKAVVSANSVTLESHTTRLDAQSVTCLESGTRLDELNTRFATLDASLTALAATEKAYEQKHADLDRATGLGLSNMETLMITLHPDAGWTRNGKPIEIKKAAPTKPTKPAPKPAPAPTAPAVAPNGAK